MNIKAMLNAYPDSMGNKLSDIVSLLQSPEFKDTFSSFYILPSVFNTDLDRGFSLIDYELSEKYACQDDIKNLHELNIDLMLDFILNHISVLSKQFQDILKNGEESKYKDFFINWNKFWQGCGQMNEDGYIEPEQKYIENMFFRKEGLPILMVRFPDGQDIPYWNTFYQEVIYNKTNTLEFVSKLNMQYETAKKVSELVNNFIDTKAKLDTLDLKEYNKYLNDVKKYLNDHRSYLGKWI